jgi:P-type Cu2+ transporter
MMVSVGLYLNKNMSNDMLQFLLWVSVLFTVPVLSFSALPFFKSAWNDLKNLPKKQFQVGMDVPISLAMLLAFFASLWNTVFLSYDEPPHVYYDSVVMFCFFLLISRYVELMSRKKATEKIERIIHVTPNLVTKVEQGTDIEVGVKEVKKGDLIKVKAGSTIPLDSTVMNGSSAVNESLLTGESRPKQVGVGDFVIGGSLNVGHPLLLKVKSIGNESVFAQMLDLLDQAQTNKPKLRLLIDRVASYFVLAVLLIAGCVAVYGYYYTPDTWFVRTLAVLVVTCPCALSLATPVALTSAVHRLSEKGVLVTQGDVLEKLTRIKHVIFDKTGTLTQNMPKIQHMKNFSIDPDLGQEKLLQIASSLQSYSEHSLANAFDGENLLEVEQIKVYSGRGISGVINQQRYFLGSLFWMFERLEKSYVLEKYTQVALFTDNDFLALFNIEDALRPKIAEMIQQLKRLGYKLSLLSGDQTEAVKKIAQEIDIQSYQAQQSPEQKLTYVSNQSEGILMVGDGINDAPVLAAADVSVAMGSAADLALNQADLILLANHPQILPEVFALANKTLTIIRQNMIWALSYNVMALPLAILGYITPWMAAIGMSLSSLIVVLNARRL